MFSMAVGKHTEHKDKQTSLTERSAVGLQTAHSRRAQAYTQARLWEQSVNTPQKGS